jgi:cytosine/adenosine deaminase-related metal-dependent hydrolase
MCRHHRPHSGTSRFAKAPAIDLSGFRSDPWGRPRSLGRQRNGPDMLKALTAPEAGWERAILFRNCGLVTMDDARGEMIGDILVADGVIKAIGADLVDLPEGVIEVDANGLIAMPGMIEGHLHSWEAQTRQTAVNADHYSYTGITHQGLGLNYRPFDMYVGNLLSALTCLDGGITTLIDNSHNSRTPDHTNAAVEALFDSGIRAIHATGKALAGDVTNDWATDTVRVKKEYFASDDQLVTMRLYCTTPTREVWELARDLDLWVSTECSPHLVADVLERHKEGLLNDRHTFMHCVNLPADLWSRFHDAGVNVNMCPRSDAQNGIGSPFNAVDSALEYGFLPGLSNDNEISYGIDMFAEMRLLFYSQRSFALHRQEQNIAGVPPVTAHDVLQMATLGGAKNCGMEGRIGQLKPGLRADIVFLDTNDLNMMPANNLLGSVVGFAGPANVAAVFIDGRVRKWEGKLVGYDLDKLYGMVEQSRDYLIHAAGLEDDINRRATPLADNFDINQISHMAQYDEAVKG